MLKKGSETISQRWTAGLRELRNSKCFKTKPE